MTQCSAAIDAYWRKMGFCRNCFQGTRIYLKRCSDLGPEKVESVDEQWKTEPEAWKAGALPFCKKDNREAASTAMEAEWKSYSNTYKGREVQRIRPLVTLKNFIKQKRTDGMAKAAATNEFMARVGQFGKNQNSKGEDRAEITDDEKDQVVVVTQGKRSGEKQKGEKRGAKRKRNALDMDMDMENADAARAEKVKQHILQERLRNVGSNTLAGSDSDDSEAHSLVSERRSEAGVATAAVFKSATPLKDSSKKTRTVFEECNSDDGDLAEKTVSQMASRVRGSRLSAPIAAEESESASMNSIAFFKKIDMLQAVGTQITHDVEADGGMIATISSGYLALIPTSQTKLDRLEKPPQTMKKNLQNLVDALKTAKLKLEIATVNNITSIGNDIEFQHNALCDGFAQGTEVIECINYESSKQNKADRRLYMHERYETTKLVNRMLPFGWGRELATLVCKFLRTTQGLAQTPGPDQDFNICIRNQRE